MLNVYVPCQNDTIQYDRVLKGKVESNLLQDFKIFEQVESEYKRQKLIISPDWDADAMASLSHSDSGRFVQNTIHGAEDYIDKAIHETSDLYLVLTTKTLYEQDVMAMLIGFLKTRHYTDGLIEIFITVLQELITNAVIHGNLGLDLYLADILDPTDFNPENAERLQETFVKIQDMLNTPSYGEKPVLLRMNCFDEAITLDIQDQGSGFDFEAFQKKYRDTKLVKGMDLVFLMSKDLEYNSETKTTSIILEDPDKKKAQELDIHSDKIHLGIYTADEKIFNAMNVLLSGTGFQNIERIPPGQTQWSEISKTINLLLILSDIPPEQMIESVEKIRQYTTQIDLPILCQKAENTSFDFIKKLSKNVNDFFSSDILVYELLSRVKAHLSMAQAQQNFSKFYAHYKSEIIQSKKTIEHFEKIPLKILRDLNNQKKLCIVVSGSQTVMESTKDIDLIQEKSKIPYGNGFSFNCGDQEYCLFISMRNGLSSVLVMSYLKGYVERLKEGGEHLNPADIIQRIQSFVAEILPVSVDINVFCTRWDRNHHALQYGQQGMFTSIKYDSVTDQLQILDDKNTVQSPRNYEVHEKHLLYIFDAAIPIDHEQLLTLSKRIFTEKMHNASSIENADMNLYSAHNIKTPYLVILPYKKQEHPQ